MIDSNPFSIHIFVTSGDPDGLRIVERSNWSGKALVFPRSLLPEIKKRKEFQQTGIYLLFGSSDDGEGEMLYIGEGDPVLPRLESHYAKKDFWSGAAFFSTNTGTLNKAHIQYLEARLVQLATLAKRVQLDNIQQPKYATLTEADQADMEVFIGHMLQILPLIGVTAFEVPAKPKNKQKQFYIDAKGIHAEGYELNDGFVVKEGSQVTLGIAAAMQKKQGTYFKLRQKLFDSGVIQKNNNAYIFNQNYGFNSPSAAASVVLGTSSNGRTIWKNSKGMTLKKIQETQAGNNGDF